MEVLNEFMVMGQLDAKYSKTFECVVAGIKKNGAEIYLNLSGMGSNQKLWLTTYCRENIDPYLGKWVVVKGFFRIASYAVEDSGKTKFNYVTKCIIKENGGIIPFPTYTNYKVYNPTKFSKANQKTQQNKNQQSNDNVIVDDDDIWS